jgi:DNA primase small subunit
MQEQTRAYLGARFGDYYAQSSIPEPPAPNRREWGYIPFSTGSTTMVRHRSLLELGTLSNFLARQAPRHVYYSAARYDDPDAGTMSAKGWRGADLVFDLDADHLPEVDEEEDSLEFMLEECKETLKRLLDFLERDFGCHDLSIVFSGGRGYHVHVREKRILQLGKEERQEIADYISGEISNRDAIRKKNEVYGQYGREVADRWSFKSDGGWGRRVYEQWNELFEDLDRMDDDEAVERVTEFEGIGQGTANKLLETLHDTYEEFKSGNLELGGAAARRLTGAFIEQERIPMDSSSSAAIDEPVTTDLHRLIRLPGSIHGGTGLRVTPVERGALEAFDPFEDAVPDAFRGDRIAVDVQDPGATPFPAASGDGTFTVQEGVNYVPEHVGVFLMAHGRAEKGKEG